MSTGRPPEHIPPTQPEPAHPGGDDASQGRVREFLDSLAPARDGAADGATVFSVLRALGYGAGTADLAMARALSRGSWPLSRHIIKYDGESGLYEITPKKAEGVMSMTHTGFSDCPVRPPHDPCHIGSPELPGYAVDAMTALSVLSAWRKQVRGTPAVPDDPYHPPGSCDACAVPLPAAGSIALSEVLGIIEAVDAWLDGDVAETYREQPLAQDWARTAKVAEESGEAREEMDAWQRIIADQMRVSEIDVPAGRAIAALIAVTGQNPRKGVHGTREALLKELGDVVCTGLFAIQHFTKDADTTWGIITEALAKAMSRVPAGSPFPPESGMTRQDAIDNGIIG